MIDPTQVPASVDVFEKPNAAATPYTGRKWRPTAIVAHTAARHVIANEYRVAISERSSVHVGSPPGHDHRYFCHTNTAR